MRMIFAACAALVLAEVGINLLLRPQEGPAALAAVFEVHLLAAGAVAGVLAILLSLRSDRTARSTGARSRLIGAVVVVVAVVRLGGECWSPQAADPGSARGIVSLSVMSWNLAPGSRSAAGTVAGIAGPGADLVAVQELTPDVAAAMEADPALRAQYPYRILEARDGTTGLGLLSRMPLVVGTSSTDPPILRAGLLLADGRSIAVLDVHPIAPVFSVLGGIPVGLDTRRRDAELTAIRGAVAALPDPGAALVLGDLNTTPFEPGFGTLTGGDPLSALTDAHEAAGTGPGFTWRPTPLERFGIGLLRIDHVLTGARLHATAVREDCSLAGDHCRLLVTLVTSGG
jgi:endonuclease/exonuclease/phosphatase (EEP) superfamily protein YafD